MRSRQWQWLGAASIVSLIATLVGTQSRAEELKTNATAVAASEARLKRDVTFLASDECEGRGPETKGLILAGDYIANEFKKAGLKPGGVDGSYFQPFAVAGAKLDSPARFVLTSPSGVQLTLDQGKDFNPLGISGSGKAKEAGLVFAGYGITGESRVPKTPKPKDDSAMGDPKPEEKEEKYVYDDY